jgi:hypothetical protein
MLPNFLFKMLPTILFENIFFGFVEVTNTVECCQPICTQLYVAYKDLEAGARVYGLGFRV